MAFEEIDLSKLKTYRAAGRPSKVTAAMEAGPIRSGISMAQFLSGLPDTLKVRELKAVARAVIDAKKKNKPVIAMIGGHVIKTGCSPILADLAEAGYIHHFASNGSAAVHDTELARIGQTSEDVAEQLIDGSFGMASDTAQFINSAAVRASRESKGFGETMGAMLVEQNPPHVDRALIARCHKLKIPYTLHIGIGTDIVHQHPSADGGAIGESSLRDFRILAATVARLGQGGVVLNFGSAVIMPEVFLKALAVARNVTGGVAGFTTANFDMIQHYRPRVNVIERPVQGSGHGYAITGHHEIMIPLLAATIYESSVA
jgi:hypothetical protein